MKQAASALPQLWVLSHVSVRIPERPHWAIWSTKIWFTSWNRWNVPGVTDLVRPLVFHMNFGVKYNVIPAVKTCTSTIPASPVTEHLSPVLVAPELET